MPEEARSGRKATGLIAYELLVLYYTILWKKESERRGGMVVGEGAIYTCAYYIAPLI